MIVKICGVTRPADAAAAVAAGADWLGLNFWPGSRRVVDREAARACARAARAAAAGRELTLVGVFVNQGEDEIAEIARGLGLDLVQLHGDEPPEVCAALGARGRGAGFRVVKAVAVRADPDVAQVLAYEVDALLVDAPCPGYGGSGQTGDWALARAVVAACERRARPCPVILAGGLRAENVAAAVAQVRPGGVDVASGVESAPGIKDGARMQAFVERARAAWRAHGAGDTHV